MDERDEEMEEEYYQEQRELDSDNNIVNNIESKNIPNNPNNQQTEEKILQQEINDFENEKNIFYSQRGKQSDQLQNYMETIFKLLASINQSQITNANISQNNNNEYLFELMTLNSKINEIESAEAILEEERNYFEEYKKNSENLLTLKKEEIEKLKYKYEKEENELNKKYEELENKEKILNEKLNEFENQKKTLSDRYNLAIQKEAELQNAALRIENSRRELDNRNIALNNERQMINNTLRLIQNEIIENNLGKNNIQQEKKNLKLRQDTIDSLRMKYLGNNINENFEYSNNENNFNNNNNYLSSRLFNKERNYNDNNQNNFENLKRIDAKEYLLKSDE